MAWSVNAFGLAVAPNAYSIPLPTNRTLPSSLLFVISRCLLFHFPDYCVRFYFALFLFYLFTPVSVIVDVSFIGSIPFGMYSASLSHQGRPDSTQVRALCCNPPKFWVEIWLIPLRLWGVSAEVAPRDTSELRSAARLNKTLTHSH